ncbi:hypothetical protein LTR42_004164 [Elasticomyces elasticus]|nr:hypothetical protein LTR42_004164 [Elasticomyces elasticus]
MQRSVCTSRLKIVLRRDGGDCACGRLRTSDCVLTDTRLDFIAFSISANTSAGSHALNLSCVPKLMIPIRQPGTSKPVARTLEAAQERTKAVTQKVRSSITGLTPREQIYNLPNLLTVSRLVAAPVTAYLLVHDQYTWALALFAYAGITDLVDGWLARRWKLQTVAGSVMDPMADKALMIILTVTLAVKGALPLYLATLILGRDASLAIAAIYYRYASLPAPKTFMRYWDFTLPSAEVHPTTVSKYNTFLQLMLIGSTLALPVVTASGHTVSALQGMDLHQAMTYFQWLVAGTTAWSGLSYAFLKNAVTIMGTNEELKAKQGARGRAIIGVTFGNVVAAATYFGLTAEEEELERQPKVDLVAF